MPLINEISQHAYDRLKAEYEDLTTRDRIDMARQVKDDRDVVDSEEGGDYHAAKEEQGQMQARIDFLEKTLENAAIVQAPHDGTIGTGSVVEIRYGASEEIETYLFGSIEECRDGIEDLSPSSPLGVVLAGKKIGDTMSFKDGSGHDLSVQVVSVI